MVWTEVGGLDPPIPPWRRHWKQLYDAMSSTVKHSHSTNYYASMSSFNYVATNRPTVCFWKLFQYVVFVATVRLLRLQLKDLLSLLLIYL